MFGKVQVTWAVLGIAHVELCSQKHIMRMICDAPVIASVEDIVTASGNRFRFEMQLLQLSSYDSLM